MRRASAIAAAAPTAPAAATTCPAFPGSESAGGGGAPASRSAALPARPWPSVVRVQEELGRRRLRGPGADSAGARCTGSARGAPAAPAAHGGGAAQSRGGFRRTGGSVGSGGGGGPSSSRPSSMAAAAGTALGAVSARSPAPRACAASRRAQSWNVGQTGNALDRQYASWCATARGAGGDSAKQRCRWSGLVDRPSRSSPKATNGQAGAPSMLGSPRSVIRAMIPGPLASNAPGELAHCHSNRRDSCSPLAPR